MLKPDGSSYGEGDRLVQTDLANTLEAIASKGPQGFYEGEIAEKIAAAVRDAGGVMTADDFRKYRREGAQAGAPASIAATRSSRCRRRHPAAHI